MWSASYLASTDSKKLPDSHLVCGSVKLDRKCQPLSVGCTLSSYPTRCCILIRSFQKIICLQLFLSLSWSTQASRLKFRPHRSILVIFQAGLRQARTYLERSNIRVEFYRQHTQLKRTGLGFNKEKMKTVEPEVVAIGK